MLGHAAFREPASRGFSCFRVSAGVAGLGLLSRYRHGPPVRLRRARTQEDPGGSNHLSAMKNRSFLITLAAGFLILAAVAVSQATEASRLRSRAQSAGLSSVRLSIREMTCTVCRVSILHALAELDGVTETVAERRGVVVAYDPSRLSPDVIVEAVAKTGYRAKLAEPDS
jgi:copper chaperone CopZ